MKKQSLNTKPTQSIFRWSGTGSLTLLRMIVVKQNTWNVRITNHLEISQKIPKCWRFKSSSQQGDLCGRKIAHTETISRSQSRVLTFCTVCKQEHSDISNSQEGTSTTLTQQARAPLQGLDWLWEPPTGIRRNSLAGLWLGCCLFSQCWVTQRVRIVILETWLPI